MAKIALYAHVLCFSLSMASANVSSAQRQHLSEISVNLDYEGESLLGLLNEIENSSDFTFAYVKKDMKGRRVNLAKGNWSMDHLLREISVQAKVSLRRVNENITITQVNTGNSYPEVSEQIIADVTVSGIVQDAAGNPLPGASILQKGTSNGTVSNIEGKYTLSVPEDAVLLVSFIGYTTQEVAVNGKSTINVTLIEDAEQLEEIVVVGYGTQKRAQVTGAIGSVDAKDIVANPIATVDQALQGRAAGVTVINNGSPGAPATIRIRGLSSTNNNEPLYVIDGVISSSIQHLNASDIESMQVLKDASTTAVYGAKGANGVILVTTKGGQKGVLQVSFDSYLGSQWTTNRYDLLNTEQYLQYAGEVWSTPGRSGDMLNNDTDWQDEIFQNGMMQNYNVAVSGGGENSTFRISGGYVNQDGILISTGMERYNLRANSTFQKGKLTAGQNIMLAVSSMNPESNNGGRSVIEHAIKVAPYLPVRNPDNLGGFQGPNSPLDGQDAENPVRVLEHPSRVLDQTTVIGNAYAQYEVIDGLKLKTQIGTELANFSFNGHTPSYNDDSEGTTHSQPYALITKQFGSLYTYIFTNSVTYNKSFAGNHNVELLLLSEYTNTDTELFNGQSQNTLSDAIDALSNISSNMSSNSNSYTRLGYLTRINYDYAGKYIFAASYRRDASSRFGPNEKWGTFPSLALGWRVSEESFLSGVSAISNLKLRASWGITGNDNIPNYGFAPTIADGFNYSIGGGNATGSTLNGIANPDLKWEENTMTNVGLDMGFMSDKITLAAEYYINRGSDILMPVSTPISSGFNQPSVLQNAGEIETKGLELTLGYNDFSGDFQWSALLNIGTTKNEVISIGSNEVLDGANFENENLSRLVVGQPAFQFWGWQFDGIFQSQAEVDAHAGGTQADMGAAPGDFRIVDTNGDNMITADDRTFIGNPFPTLSYGLNLSAQYKGFDFGLFLNGVSGNDVYNTNIYDLEGMPRLFNSGTAVLNRWTEAGSSNSVPRAGGAASNLQASSRYVEDGSFTRLRNLTLGYDLAQSVLDGKLQKFRVYITAQNLLTITGYSGLDPEIGAPTAFDGNTTPGGIGAVRTNANGTPVGNFEQGIDRGNYPVPKAFIGGIQILF